MADTVAVSSFGNDDDVATRWHGVPSIMSAFEDSKGQVIQLCGHAVPTRTEFKSTNQGTTLSQGCSALITPLCADFCNISRCRCYCHYSILQQSGGERAKSMALEPLGDQVSQTEPPKGSQCKPCMYRDLGTGRCGYWFCVGATCAYQIYNFKQVRLNIANPTSPKWFIEGDDCLGISWSVHSGYPKPYPPIIQPVRKQRKHRIARKSWFNYPFCCRQILYTISLLRLPPRNLVMSSKLLYNDQLESAMSIHYKLNLEKDLVFLNLSISWTPPF